MARPLIEIDEKLLQELAKAQLTNREIARICECSEDTLSRRFADSIKEWRDEGVGCVRRELFTTAMSTSKGKVTAMIFFLKNYGGLCDVTRQEREPLGFGSIPTPEWGNQPREADKPN